jgi:hypothetical protein
VSASLLAPGFYAGTFELCGSWFDIARVDSWAQGVFMLGLLFVRGHRLREQLTAAACFYLAFMSKQSTVAMFAPVLIWAMSRRGLNAWIAAGVLLVGSLISVASMQYASHGWYWYYCVELPSSHPWVDHVWKSFWTTDLVNVWPAFVAWTGMALFAARRRFMDRDFGLAVATLLGGLGTSWFSRLHSGGFLNVLLPAFAGIGLTLGTSVGQACRLNRPFGSILLVVALVQLWMLDFDPKPNTIDERDWSAARQVQAAVSAIEGDVFAPEANSYLIRAGKEPRPHAVAIADVLRGGKDEPRSAFLAAFDAAVAARRFSAVIVMDVSINGAMLPIFEREYRMAQELQGPFTRTGVKARVLGILRAP